MKRARGTVGHEILGWEGNRRGTPERAIVVREERGLFDPCF